MKAWVVKDPVSPVKKLWDPGGVACGVCGVDDDLLQGMELAEDEKEDGVNVGEEVKRFGKEDDERKENVRKMVDPRRPTKQEVEDHELFHLPHRNWCPDCIRANGKELDHRKSLEEPRGLSEYSFDYCFPGDEFGYKLTILSGKEKVTGMNFATAVPTT